MFLKIKKSKKILQKVILCCLISFLGFSYIEKSIAGLYSQEGDQLLNELVENLIKENVCKNISQCNEMLWMWRRDGKKIELSMYEQTDSFLSSHVTSFFIQHGIKITKGMPITLIIYSEPKTEYLDLKHFFINNGHLIKLDIKK